MKKYWTFFRIRFTSGLQYRSAAYAGIATQFAWGFLTILMFRAFYETDPSVFPMTFSQLSSYIWLQQAFLTMLALWIFDNEIFAHITSGSIAYELSRPLDLYRMWMVKNLALRLSRAALRCLPILAVAFFLPEPFRLILPTFPNFLLFLLTLVLGFFVVTAFAMLVYIATFYTMSPTGLRFILVSTADLLSGSLIPLPFFPEKVRRVVELLPFASMENIPLRVYSGALAGAELGRAILLQLFWLLTLTALGKLWMRCALRRVVVQGG